MLASMGTTHFKIPINLIALCKATYNYTKNKNIAKVFTNVRDLVPTKYTPKISPSALKMLKIC